MSSVKVTRCVPVDDDAESVGLRLFARRVPAPCVQLNPTSMSAHLPIWLAGLRIDLVRAKSSLVKVLDLPAGRYMHSIQLAYDKFQ